MVCELDPCPWGAESVLVGEEVAPQPSGRMLLFRTQPPSQSVGQRDRDQHQTARHEEHLPHRATRDGDIALLRGHGRTRQSRDEEEGTSDRMSRRRQGPRHRRRRLMDIEGLAFTVPSEGGTEGDDGRVMTESQQAAAFVNNMADPVSEGRDSNMAVFFQQLPPFVLLFSLLGVRIYTFLSRSLTSSSCFSLLLGGLPRSSHYAFSYSFPFSADRPGGDSGRPRRGHRGY